MWSRLALNLLGNPGQPQPYVLLGSQPPKYEIAEVHLHIKFMFSIDQKGQEIEKRLIHPICHDAPEN